MTSRMLCIRFYNGDTYGIDYETARGVMADYREPDSDEDLIDYIENNVNWDEIADLATLLERNPKQQLNYYEEEWPNVSVYFTEKKQRDETPMELINLTPHEIIIVLTNEQRTQIRLPASGVVARVDTQSTDLTPLYLPDGTEVPVKRSILKEVVGLPDTKPKVGYVVSRLVLEAVKHERYDVFSPGEFVRNDQGQIVGCLGLSC